MKDRPLSFDPVAEARRQWLEHRWPAADQMAAATSIMRAQQIVLSRADAALRPLGLTFARYEVLALLFFSRRGALPMGKVGERLMVHPTSVTNAVDRLEADGLVSRQPDPNDRRTVLAQLTPAGRRLVDKATRALTTVRFGLAELDDDDSASLFELVRRLRLAAGDFDGSSREAGPA